MTISCLRKLQRALAIVSLAWLFLPGSGHAAGTTPLFDVRNPDAAPFPSNRHTALDLRNLTKLRVDLPKPDCAQRPSDCRDIEVINTLDGFSLQPRLRIPFSSAIDPSSVDSSNLFLVRLGGSTHRAHLRRETIGIDRVVWDPVSNTLFAQPQALLEEHTNYLLVVTDGIRDARGHAVGGGEFAAFVRNLRGYRHRDAGTLAYRAALLAGIAVSGVAPHRIAAASVFTTQSATAVLEKIRTQVQRGAAAHADLALASDGSRAIYPLSSLSSIVFNRQIATAGFQAAPLPLAALAVLPNSVGSIAFGRYRSPDYQTAQQFIPPVHTRSGRPIPQRVNDVFFNLYLPAGPRPAAGWPVTIYGHGFGDSKQGSSFAVASVLASRGIATIAINAVGHGGGRAGSLIVNRNGLAPLTLPAGGRGIDQNGDGLIDATEGVNAVPPREIINNRDGLRQTVVDLMQLVHVIQTGGVDLDGDGVCDLDSDRIYYVGQSFGGIYGTITVAVEPALQAAVLNVPGGSITEIARLSVFRPLAGQTLGARTPSLLNSPPFAPPLFGFNENLPLRNQPALTNEVPGAIAIQDFLDRAQWVGQSGDPVAYAPHIRKDPLHGLAPKRVIVQIAKGDGVVPNPTNSALIRAGDLADRTTYFRNDLAFAINPALPKNPHTFLTNLQIPASAPLAVAAQTQVAVFLASDGNVIIDPDGPGPLFETPIVEPLPETSNFLP